MNFIQIILYLIVGLLLIIISGTRLLLIGSEDNAMDAAFMLIGSLFITQARLLCDKEKL